MKLTDSLHAGRNSHKLKGDWKWVSLVKNWCGQSGDGTLKLTVSEDWTDGITFLCAHTDSQKSKVDQNFFMWAWPFSLWDVISPVSYEWIYKFSWFFECW